MKKLFSFFKRKTIPVGMGRRLLRLSSPAAAFIFSWLILLLLSFPDPTAWPSFGAVKFLLPLGWLFLEEGVGGGPDPSLWR